MGYRVVQIPKLSNNGAAVIWLAAQQKFLGKTVWACVQKMGAVE
jgi:hypothetical protein